MPIDPVLALLAVAVTVNLLVVALIVVPLALGRGGPWPDDPAPSRDARAAVRLAAAGGRPVPEPLIDGLASGAYDRVVRIVAFVYLVAVAATVLLTGLWPETEAAILVLLLVAGIAVVVFHEILTAADAGPVRFVAEASLGITFAALLVLLTGQARSPFFLTFPLIVAGAALVVRPSVTAVLVAVASLAYLAAVVVPLGTVTLEPVEVATVTVNLAALGLLAYVAAVVAADQRRSREAAIRLSTVDSLTGLFNRSFLLAAVERELARSGRSGRAFCLLLLDLDGLKDVNDRWGHHLGDRILRGVGGAIQAGVRKIDTPARYGGDEFAVLCPETDQGGALILAEKIRQAVAAIAVDVPGQLLRPSVSIGVVAFPADGTSVEALFIAADQAMYASKRSGRNRVSAIRVARGPGVAVPIGAAEPAGAAGETWSAGPSASAV